MTAAITSVSVRVFETVIATALDSEGHDHPGPERPAELALLTVTDSDGATGTVVGKAGMLTPSHLDGFIRPVLAGRESLAREALWAAFERRQRGHAGELPDHTLAYVDQALWDLAGRKLGVPVWQLLGAARDRVPAYASTMCGDEIVGGLATPADYASFAKDLAARGYRAIKLHTWMPPVADAPDWQADARACAAVRDAVGPDIALMLDGYHWYSRTEALSLGRALEELDYTWFEEPMDESSVASYQWLSAQLNIPVIGPETAAGKHRVRAEWARLGACDILRVGVMNGGGITPALKAVHVAESFGMECEVHGGGTGNLALLGATTASRWYERGLLHPLLDHEEVPPHLTAKPDPMDSDGCVPLPAGPGLGDQLNMDYIAAHTVAAY
jgi:L-alanine-DL-glutamate epimerase-like enolase superfamily enzyme